MGTSPPKLLFLKEQIEFDVQSRRWRSSKSHGKGGGFCRAVVTLVVLAVTSQAHVAMRYGDGYALDD
jgi:hypothetical protein